MLPDQGIKTYSWFDKRGNQMKLLRAYPNKYEAYKKAEELKGNGMFGIRVRRYTITVPSNKYPEKFVRLKYWGIYAISNQYGKMLV
jgi:hypothetical protein